MLQGLLLALAAYASYSTSDALIKFSGGSAGVFEIGFFVSLFSIIPWAISRPADEPWRQMFKMNRPLLVHLRGVCSLIASIMSIYAFTHIPMAEAYALIFLVPLAVTILSVLILHEPVGWRRWLAVVGGFIGILLVVRPGFREITLAHAAGLGVAIFGGLNVVLMRQLASSETRTTLMAILVAYMLAAYFFLMLPGFVWPDPVTMLALAACGCASGLGHVLILAATRKIPANRVAPMQYSQIVWALILGAVFFAEFPDSFTYIGLAVVAGSGFFTFLREGARFGWKSKAPILHNRPRF